MFTVHSRRQKSPAVDSTTSVSIGRTRRRPLVVKDQLQQPDGASLAEMVVVLRTPTQQIELLAEHKHWRSMKTNKLLLLFTYSNLSLLPVIQCTGWATGPGPPAGAGQQQVSGLAQHLVPALVQRVAGAQSTRALVIHLMWWYIIRY